MGDGRRLAADGVVLRDGDVVLLRRSHPPHEGTWVLPGGYVERGETARAACRREVREEVGVRVEPLRFLGLYDDPDRDPRGTVSAAYLCEPEDEAALTRGDEAREVAWRDSRDPPTLGFDHGAILGDAVAARGNED